MIKVLYITNIPAPYRIDFWNELGKHVDLTVWFEAHNYKERKWNIKNLGRNFKYEFLKGFVVNSDIQINPGIIKKIKKSKFDTYILSCYNTPSEARLILWFNMNRIPFILTSDGGFVKKDNYLKKGIKKYLISSAEVWLSSGINCTEYFVHYGAKKDSIIEYPFTVDYSEKEKENLSSNEKERIKEENGLSDTVILTVGQFIHRKGIDVLLEAFKEIKHSNVSLLIIGSGSQKNDYLKFIEDNGLSNVILKDFIQKEELVKFYKISDIFVLPTREDIWGLVVNEAMNFGLPVITTTQTGAAFSLIEDGVNGYVVNVDDPQQLAEKLEILINNKNLRMEFSVKSLSKIENYTIENMVEKYLLAINKYMSFREDIQ